MSRDFVSSINRGFVMSSGRDRNFPINAFGFVTELHAHRFCFLPWRFPEVILNASQLALAQDNQKRYRKMRISGSHSQGIPRGGGPGVQTAFKEILIDWGDAFDSDVYPLPFPTITTVSETGGIWPGLVGLGPFTKTISETSCRYQFIPVPVDITISIEDSVEHNVDLEEVYNHLISVNGTSLGNSSPAWVNRFDLQIATPFLRQGPDVVGSYVTMPPSWMERSTSSGPMRFSANGMINDFASWAVDMNVRKCHIGIDSSKVWTTVDGGVYSQGYGRPTSEIACGVEAIAQGVLMPPPIEFFDDVLIPIRRNGTYSRYAFPTMTWDGGLVPTCA